MASSEESHFAMAAMAGGNPVREHMVREHMGRLLAWLAPNRCPGCDQIIDERARFCGKCLLDLHMHRAPSCKRCGFAIVAIPDSLANDAHGIKAIHFPSGDGGWDHEVCTTCRRNPIPWGPVGSCVDYDRNGLSARLVLRLKYSGRVDLARPMAVLMRPACRTLKAFQDTEPPVVIPIPLHPRRLIKRGYNQAALLAGHIGNLMGWHVERDAVVRHIATQPLASDGPQLRYERLRNVFSPRKRLANVIKGRSVIIVDDVATTGATIAALAPVLRDAGAVRVEAVVFARSPLARPIETNQQEIPA